MTQPNDLPPLPEPTWITPGYRYEGAMIYTAEHMAAYGLQCAEAAVERERARCWREVVTMANKCREATKPESTQEHRDYAATLLLFVANQIK